MTMSRRAFLFSLTLFILLAVGHSGPASALEKCVVSDPKDPTLNVRAEPRGKVIGRVKNGQAVYILNRDEIHYGGDKYRTWSHIAGEAGGTLKPLGWVFQDHLSCKAPKNSSEDYPLLVGPGIDPAPETKGFAIDGFMKEQANRCYYYGDGGPTLSISDDVLRSFEARGFSLNSVCLGILSVGVQFDPKTGRRLPSMMYVDLSGVEQFIKCSMETHNTLPPGCDHLMEELELAEAMSNEFIIDLPDCFKAGAPYSDCEMNYDMATGRKIDASEKNFLGWQGQEIEAMLKEAVAQGVSCKMGEECDKELDGQSQWGLDGLFLEDTLRQVKSSASPLAGELDGLTLRTGITAYDISPVFPRGFGYAIGPDGGAGPSANLQSAKLALAQKDRMTRAKIQALEDDPASQ